MQNRIPLYTQRITRARAAMKWTEPDPPSFPSGGKKTNDEPRHGERRKKTLECRGEIFDLRHALSLINIYASSSLCRLTAPGPLLLLLLESTVTFGELAIDGAPARRDTSSRPLCANCDHSINYFPGVSPVMPQSSGWTERERERERGSRAMSDETTSLLRDDYCALRMSPEGFWMVSPSRDESNDMFY